MWHRRTLFGTGLAMGLGGAAQAQGQGWVRLGAREVDLVSDRDRIPVTWTEGSFSAIRLEVRGNGVFFDDLDITFGNGERLDVPVRRFIPAGGTTRVIGLPGGGRLIRHVDLRYRRAAGGGRAAVVLLGRR